MHKRKNINFQIKDTDLIYFLFSCRSLFLSPAIYLLFIRLNSFRILFFIFSRVLVSSLFSLFSRKWKASICSLKLIDLFCSIQCSAIFFRLFFCSHDKSEGMVKFQKLKLHFTSQIFFHFLDIGRKTFYTEKGFSIYFCLQLSQLQKG